MMKKGATAERNFIENDHGVLTHADFRWLVDLGDFQRVRNYLWSDVSDGYANNSKLGSLHRHLMNARRGEIVDHINGDIYDNRRINLRVCTNSDNRLNSLYRKDRGIYKTKQNHYKVELMVRGIRNYLGTFITLDGARKSAKDFMRANAALFNRQLQ